MERNNPESNWLPFIPGEVVPVFKNAIELADDALAHVAPTEDETVHRRSRRVGVSVFLAHLHASKQTPSEMDTDMLHAMWSMVLASHMPVPRLRLASLLKANITQKTELITLSAHTCYGNASDYFDRHPDEALWLQVVEATQAQEAVAEHIGTIESALIDNAEDETNRKEVFIAVHEMISALEPGSAATQLRFILQRVEEYKRGIAASDELIEGGILTSPSCEELTRAKQELRQFVAQFEHED